MVTGYVLHGGDLYLVISKTPAIILPASAFTPELPQSLFLEELRNAAPHIEEQAKG